MSCLLFFNYFVSTLSVKQLVVRVLVTFSFKVYLCSVLPLICLENCGGDIPLKGFIIRFLFLQVVYALRWINVNI